MTKEDKIREDLKTALENEPGNYAKILDLSAKLTAFDKEQIRFSIDAGLIDRLGKELVARQETAVSELVKNAYDADSSEVILTFIDSDKIGGTLKIQDNGDGMTRSQLVNGFMRISSSDKIHNPYSTKYKRKRAGQKGIGRFAVQRLGTTLTIITQTEDAENALMLKVNWEEYKKDVDLYSISNSLKLIPKVKEKGTTLIIDNLREKWTEAAIQRIYGYVTDIIQPISLSTENTELESLRVEKTKDPGFKISFIKIVESKPKTIANKDQLYYTHAAAIIEGYIDEAGVGIYSIQSDKLNINDIGKIGNDPDDNNIPFDKLKNVRFKAYYFIYDSDLVPKTQSASIRRLAEKQGGIRLYRNGFRVLPYGEPSNDWLKLDKSLRTRSILPSHGNNNFFGFVELTDRDNKFNETSSREGLTENEAFIQLQNFVYRTLITGVIKVAEVRNVKIKTNQQKSEDGDWEKIEFRIKNIAHTLEELDQELDIESGKTEVRNKRKRAIKKLRKEIDEVSRLQKDEHDKYLKEKSMLRVLSSVGLTIAQFIHEIKYYMNNIQSDIRFLVQKLEKEKALLDRVKILDKNFSSFHTYTSYFDNVISQNVIRELRPLDLRKIVEPFISSIESDAKKANIEFIPRFLNYRLFTKPMHPSEWSSILFNFYTNSKKAIKRANADSGIILIECGEIENCVYLEFSDNGDGISKENEEKVFNEFFTTTSPQDFNNINSSEILGTGLGLKIVKDIVSSYKGDIKVVSPKEDFSTCFRIEIPRATEKELEFYGI